MCCTPNIGWPPRGGKARLAPEREPVLVPALRRLASICRSLGIFTIPFNEGWRRIFLELRGTALAQAVAEGFAQFADEAERLLKALLLAGEKPVHRLDLGRAQPMGLGLDGRLVQAEPSEHGGDLGLRRVINEPAPREIFGRVVALV